MSKRLVKEQDLFELHSVTNPQLSPDGTQCLFIKTQMDEEQDTYISNVFHINIETEQVTQWTYGQATVSNPTWSKDGKNIAFLSDRTDKKQLYIISCAGGEAEQITFLEDGITDYEWSPCGQKIWITTAVAKGLTVGEKVEEIVEEKLQPVRITTMKYKADRIGILPTDTYQQIAIVSIKTKEIEQFTIGDYHHTFQGISNDGKYIVMSVNRTAVDDYLFHSPLYLVEVASKKEVQINTVDGNYGRAVFSPDDAYIAVVGTTREYENATHSNLYIYHCLEKTFWNATEMLDAPVGDYAVADVQQNVTTNPVVWTAQNDLYFQLSTMGDVRLYYASLDGAIFPASPEGEHVYGFDVRSDGCTAVIAASNPINPGELYAYDITTGDRVALTTFNDKYIQDVILVMPEKIQYPSDEFSIHGWLMKPANYEEGKSYPLIVEVHGGPHAMYANTFFHELQLLAAEGYGVLYVNPRGSHSYSQQFVNAVRNDYGGGDYRDIMQGVDRVVAEHKWINPARLGVTGGSYGGFMTNWIVSHTNRFKAAVTQRSIANWVSFFGVSDIGYYFSEWQIGASMKDVDTLWDHSPLKYAESIEAPLLILHAERDFRCPIEQAEQLYMTLKSLGKVTEFVRFPKADHNLSREGNPHLRLERLKEIIGWFDRYL